MLALKLELLLGLPHELREEAQIEVRSDLAHEAYQRARRRLGLDILDAAFHEELNDDATHALYRLGVERERQWEARYRHLAPPVLRAMQRARNVLRIELRPLALRLQARMRAQVYAETRAEQWRRLARDIEEAVRVQLRHQFEPSHGAHCHRIYT